MALRHMRSDVLKRIIKVLPPYLFLRLPPLPSRGDSPTEGFGIITPFLPEHVITWGEAQVLQKVVAGCQLAKQLGAKIVGLAGFASVVGNEGEEIAREVEMPVTSGNTLTAGLALQGLRNAAQKLGIPLSEATVAVIGATGDIGSICARVLSKEAARLKIAARNVTNLEALADKLREGGGCPVEVVKYVYEAVRGSDIVLTATSAITTIIDPADVKPGAVICDIALPHNVGDDIVRVRDDVLVFEGGLASLPEGHLSKDQRWRRVSPDGTTIFGCLAETWILALEGRWESYSLGRGNITPERVNEMMRLAARHGFRVADFRYRNVLFDEERLRKIRENAARSSRRYGTASVTIAV